MAELDKRYDPSSSEERWYAWWEQQGFFRADPDRGGTPYTIVIPPPNITGFLHMGHALNNTLQDVLIRWKRMAGFNTLWLPGTDHASIATEAVVTRKLTSEGLAKREMGRDLGEDLAQEFLYPLPRCMCVDLVAQGIDQIDQFTMLEVDVRNASFKILAPLDEGHRSRYLKRKPPCSALKSMARFCHCLSSASMRWSKSKPSVRLLSRSFASMT